MRSATLLLKPILLFAVISSSFAAKFSVPKGTETPWEEEAIWLNGLRLSAASSPSGAFSKTINTNVDDFTMLFAAFPQLKHKITNIYDLERAGLSQGKLQQHTWSYHAFPLQRGGLANRYNDENFRNLKDWNDRYLYTQALPAQALITRGQTQELSPLEKYEYFIGNKDFSLTHNEWREGLALLKHHGSIPPDFGAYRGSAPAAIKHQRPHRSVSVLAYDGKQKITFSPADIKALLAYAWAKNSSESFMMGGRCEFAGDKSLRNCYDLNPGAFHLALTNLLGLHHKALIVDTSPDTQVVNRPIVGYELRYFNPQTRNDTKKLSEAVIKTDDFQDDPFKRKRSKSYRQVVGVWANLTYVDQTPPHNNEDSLIQDRYASIQFTYDLELDEKGNILGGMWYEENLPDFVWVVSDRALPLALEDRLMLREQLDYDGNSPLPASMRELAVASSARGQISYKVLSMLLELAK